MNNVTLEMKLKKNDEVWIWAGYFPTNETAKSFAAEVKRDHGVSKFRIREYGAIKEVFA